jgi:hypothetical protein
MQRWPKGYAGIDHETSGSALLSVLQICPFPDEVLGTEEVQRLEEVDPEGWYPVAWLLSKTEKLERFAGSDGLLHLGRQRFQLSHQLRLPRSSAKDVIYGIEEMYRFSNRGRSIGGFTVLDFRPGHAELEKTTPLHCAIEQGILLAALESVNCPATIAQTQCFRDGADSCIYTISSECRDERWSGA